MGCPDMAAEIRQPHDHKSRVPIQIFLDYEGSGSRAVWSVCTVVMNLMSWIFARLSELVGEDGVLPVKTHNRKEGLKTPLGFWNGKKGANETDLGAIMSPCPIKLNLNKI